jgi:hypothetical protein
VRFRRAVRGGSGVAWRATTRSALALALASATLVLLAVSASSAEALTTCSAPVVSAGVSTVTCPVGTDEVWTAPTGVTMAAFDVQGAAGGAGISGGTPAGSAGKGGRTVATLPVTHGHSYHIAVVCSRA